MPRRVPIPLAALAVHIAGVFRPITERIQFALDFPRRPVRDLLRDGRGKGLCRCPPFGQTMPIFALRFRAPYRGRFIFRGILLFPLFPLFFCVPRLSRDCPAFLGWYVPHILIFVVITYGYDASRLSRDCPDHAKIAQPVKEPRHLVFAPAPLLFQPAKGGEKLSALHLDTLTFRAALECIFPCCMLYQPHPRLPLGHGFVAKHVAVAPAAMQEKESRHQTSLNSMSGKRARKNAARRT